MKSFLKKMDCFIKREIVVTNITSFGSYFIRPYVQTRNECFESLSLSYLMLFFNRYALTQPVMRPKKILFCRVLVELRVFALIGLFIQYKSFDKIKKYISIDLNEKRTLNGKQVKRSLYSRCLLISPNNVKEILSSLNYIIVTLLTSCNVFSHYRRSY